MNSFPVSQTKGSIGTEHRSARIFAYGTGEKMLFWPGWLPHRTAMSLFEVESCDLIVRIEKEELYLNYSQVISEKLWKSLFMSRQVPVGYSTANTGDLEHAATVAHRVLSMSSDWGLKGGDGGSMLVDEEKLKTAGKTQNEFQLKFAEADAVHHQKFEVLERTVLALSKQDDPADFSEQMARMLQTYCSLAGT